MADLLSRTDRHVYLRVHLTRDAFQTLVDLQCGERNALRTIRCEWEKMLRRLTDELIHGRVL